MATITTTMPTVAVNHRRGTGLAYGGLTLFMLVYCARPEDWIPSTAAIPFAKVTALLALAGFTLSLAQRPGTLLRLPREMVYLILLFVQLCLTIPFSPVWRGGAFNTVFNGFSKGLLITLVIALTVDSVGRLRRLFFLQAASVASVVVVAVWKNHRVAGMFGRLTGLLGGVYDNPNDFAFAIVLSLPFCLMFLLGTRSLLRKSAWALVMVAMVYTLLNTYSRSGLLTFVASATMCLWEFGMKGRRRHMVLLAGFVVLGLAVLAGPAQYGERLATIFHPAGDPTGSAQARRALLLHSLEVTAEHPILGIGPGNFQILSGSWHGAHNSYTLLSAEAGIPALILFLLILHRSFFNLRDTQRLGRGQLRLMLPAGALRASLFSFVVGAFFADVAYNFFPYFLVGYTTALHQIAKAARSTQLTASLGVHDAVYQADVDDHEQNPETVRNAY